MMRMLGAEPRCLAPLSDVASANESGIPDWDRSGERTASSGELLLLAPVVVAAAGALLSRNATARRHKVDRGLQLDGRHHVRQLAGVALQAVAHPEGAALSRLPLVCLYADCTGMLPNGRFDRIRRNACKRRLYLPARRRCVYRLRLLSSIGSQIWTVFRILLVEGPAP